VRLGHGVALVPQSVGAIGPGIRAVPIPDCPPSTVRIVWEQGNTSRAVADLVRHAASVRAGPACAGEKRGDRALCRPGMR
jgi:DNA-binding transcriptional LysR family regulator